MAGKIFEVAFKIAGQLSGSFMAAVSNASKSMANLKNVSNGQYGEGILRLQQTLSKLNEASSLASKFSQLKQTVKDNSTQFLQAQSRLKQLESEYKQAAQATEQLRVKASTLKSAFDTSKTATEGLKNKLRELKAAELELKASGQALKNGQPTAEFQRLQAQILRTTTQLKQSQAATKAAGDVYKQAANALKQSESAAKSAGQAYSSAKNKVDSLKATLASQRAELQQLSSALSRAGVSTNNLGQSQFALKLAVSQTTAELNRQIQTQQRLQQAQARQSQTSNEFYNATGNFSGVLSTAQQIAAPLTGSIDKAMEFEHAMSKVKALTQGENIRSGNLEQVREDMSKLTAQAQELGATTQFTMTQAAEAMSFLGMAGWKTEQIYEAMPGMLSLAAASGSDLARTSDIVSDNMTAIGVPVEKAGHFMDVYAYAMSNSNVNLETLGETMKYFAPVAKSYGASLEDATAMTMMLGNAGIKGSMAGTSLRMGLLRLAGPPKTASKEMDALGISLSDATKGALEAQAQLEALGINLDQNATPAEKMRTVLEQLGEKTKNLSQDEKLAAFKNIFGVNAETGWLALFDQGTDTFTKYRDALRKSDGYAKQMADTMNDDTRGAMIAFQSAVDGAQVAIGGAFLNSLRSVLQNITPLVSGFTQWANQHQGLVTVVGLSVAALTAFAILVAGFGAVAAGYSYGMASIGLATELLKLKWLSAGGAITAFRAKIAANYAILNGLSLASMRASFVAAMASMRASMLGVIASANAMRIRVVTAITSMSVTSVLSSAGAAIKSFGAAMLTAGRSALSLTMSMLPIIAIAAAIGIAAYLIYSNWSTVAPFFQMLWNTVSGAFQQAWTIIQPAIAQIGEAFSTLTNSIGGSQSIISVLVGAFATLLTGIAGILATIITTAANFVAMLIGIFGGITTFITGVLAGDWSTAWKGLCDAAKALVEGLVNTIKSLFGGIGETIGKIVNIAKGVFNGDVGSVAKKENARTEWRKGNGGDQSLAAAQNATTGNQIAQLTNNVLQVMQQNQQKEQGQQFAQLSQQLMTLIKSPEKNAESQQQIAQLSQQMMQSIRQAQQDAKAQGNVEAEAAATKSAEQFSQLIQSLQAQQQQQQQPQDNSGAQQNAEAQQQAAQAAQQNADAQQQAATSAEQLQQTITTAVEGFQTAAQNIPVLGEVTQQVQPQIQQLGEISQTAQPLIQQLGESSQTAQPPIQMLGETSSGAQGNIQTLGAVAGTAAGQVTNMGSAAQSVVTALQSAATQIANIKITAPSVSAAPAAANYMGGIYGKGAFLTTFAEKSPEAAIPIDGSQRAIELWQQTGAMLGVYNASTGTLDKPPSEKEQADELGNLKNYQGSSDNLVKAGDLSPVRDAKIQKQREIIEKQRQEKIEIQKAINQIALPIQAAQATVSPSETDELGNLKDYSGSSDNLVKTGDLSPIRDAKLKAQRESIEKQRQDQADMQMMIERTTAPLQAAAQNVSTILNTNQESNSSRINTSSTENVSTFTNRKYSLPNIDQLPFNPLITTQAISGMPLKAPTSPVSALQAPQMINLSRTPNETLYGANNGFNYDQRVQTSNNNNEIESSKSYQTLMRIFNRNSVSRQNTTNALNAPSTLPNLPTPTGIVGSQEKFSSVYDSIKEVTERIFKPVGAFPNISEGSSGGILGDTLSWFKSNQTSVSNNNNESVTNNETKSSSSISAGTPNITINLTINGNADANTMQSAAGQLATDFHRQMQEWQHEQERRRYQ